MPFSHTVVRPPPPLLAVLSLVPLSPRKMSACRLLPCASRSDYVAHLPINTVAGGIEVCLFFRGRMALPLPKRTCIGLVCHDTIYLHLLLVCAIRAIQGVLFVLAFRSQQPIPCAKLCSTVEVEYLV